MKLTHRIENGTGIVTLAGNLALDETIQAKAYINDVVNNPTIKNMVMNCSHLQFMDSDGIGWLAALYRKLLAEGKTLRICHVNVRNQVVLTRIGLDKVIKIYNTEEEALSQQ